ncbi:MAG TPA: hypothetical protein VMW52_09345 [Phycisphaerae bacterium]|nr:hypothetical protein [Phycisphaerae bacterium]
MSPFSAAVDACFVHLGVAAVYVPAGGAPVDVRVIAKRPDVVADFGETRIHAATAVFEVRVAEVPSPAAGDTITLDGETFVVQGEPVRDAERLVWTLDVRPA